MIARPLLLAAALLAASATAALAQARDVVAPPTLRANVTVASDIVRVGDLV
jgi:flagella basal body P-ring formation protein FlgA